MFQKDVCQPHTKGLGRLREVPADWKLASAVPVYQKGMRKQSILDLSLSSLLGKNYREEATV